jgi:hypothetical protein
MSFPATRDAECSRAPILQMSFRWTFALLLLLPASLSAQAKTNEGPRLEIYGFVMTDFGFDFGQINPDWFDVMRPTQLPSFPNEFGRNGSTFAGVRQTRFGVKGSVPTRFGELKTHFEYDMFASGPEAGQTTFHLRFAYGELGHFGAGQTWSPFTDEDILPTTLDYIGSDGLSEYRNVQVRWMPIQGDTRVTIALERPSSTQNPGRLENRTEIQNISTRFPYPDVAGEFRWGGTLGYVKFSGIAGQTRVDDLQPGQVNFNQAVNRWGLNFTSNIKTGGKNVIKMGYLFGAGMENHMNDAPPVDIGPIPNPGNPTKPFEGKSLPFRGLSAFYNYFWNDRWNSTAGYSQVGIDNSILQNPNDFHRGQYSIANVLYTPTDNILVGGEVQWGRRTNFADGFRYNDYKLQFSFKFNFDGVIVGKQ